MSETPEPPTPDTPTPDAVTEVTPATAPPPPADATTTTTAASSGRGIWKYIGAGAIGLVVGLLLAGGIAWGLGGDHDGHKGKRPPMSQHDGPRGEQRMPGRQGPQGQNGPQDQSGQQGQQAPGGAQTQPSGPMGGMSGGGRTGAG